MPDPQREEMAQEGMTQFVGEARETRGSVEVVPIDADAPAAFDPTMTVRGMAALKLIGSDPGATRQGGGLGPVLRRGLRLTRALTWPGRVSASVDITMVDGALDATMVVSVAAQSNGEAQRETAALRDVVATTLRAAPAGLEVTTIPIDHVLSSTAHEGVEILPRELVFDHGHEELRTTIPLQPLASSWEELPELLTSGSGGTRLRICTASTDLHGIEMEHLVRLADDARRVEAGSEGVAEVHAQTVAAAAERNLERLDHPRYLTAVTLLADDEIPTAWAHAVAGCLFAGPFDEEMARAGSMTTPAGGWQLRRLVGRQLRLRVEAALPGGAAGEARDGISLFQANQVAGLLRWPVALHGPLPGIAWRQPTPRSSTPTSRDGCELGAGVDGQPVRVRMPVHADISGATGAGKSTALTRLADHELRSGRSVVVFDVHRDVAARVRELALRAGAEPLAFDAGDPRSAQLRVISGAQAAAPSRALERARFADALASMWSSEMTGPRWMTLATEYLEAIEHVPGAHPIAHASTFLDDKVLTRLLRGGDPTRRIARLQRAVRASDDLAGWAASKFASLDRGPAARRIIAPVGGGVSPGEVVGRHRAVIVSLDTGSTSTLEARLLGHLFLGAFLDAALARAPAERTPVTFLVDEGRRYPAERLVSGLTEGRKFLVSMAIAYQYRSQLAAELQDALADGATLRIAFRSTADSMARGAQLGVEPGVLHGLANLEAVVSQPADDGTPRVTTVSLPAPDGSAALPVGDGADRPLPSIDCLLSA